MSIDIFEKNPGKKSHSVIPAVSLKLWGLGLRWYFVSIVPESVECRTCCLMYLTLVNSLSSASSTSSSTVLWCCSQRPERMPRRMTAVAVFGRRPSRGPTMNLRRTQASLRRLTWRWCGLKQLSCRGSWVFVDLTLCPYPKHTSSPYSNPWPNPNPNANLKPSEF